MGWKGTLRSIDAASRRANAAAERRRRVVANLENKAASIVQKIDTEVEKEIRRVERHEEKVSSHPVKTLELAFTGNEWQAAPFKEQTGLITYTLQFTPPSISDVLYEPATIDLGGVQITPRSLSVSQYFTAIEFDAAATGDKGTTLKLTYPQKPEASRIALVSASGEIFNTLDTSLDGRLFSGTTRSGLVSFEPFDEGQSECAILFEVASKGKGSAPDTVRIRVWSPTLESDIRACLAQPSILEAMTKQLRNTQQGFKDRADAGVAEVKKKALGWLLGGRQRRGPSGRHRLDEGNRHDISVALISRRAICSRLNTVLRRVGVKSASRRSSS